MEKKQDLDSVKLTVDELKVSGGAETSGNSEQSEGQQQPEETLEEYIPGKKKTR